MEGLRLALARIGLPAWFIAIDVLWITRLETLGIDARHYQRAASDWLAGGDPWLTTEGGINYAAGPHTLLFYAPTSVLALQLAVFLWLLMGLVAAAWTVRRFNVPIWWIGFPPLFHAVWNGNPQTVVLALLFVGGTAPAVVAVMIKLYAGAPLLVRPKTLLVAMIVLVATLPILPWQHYLQDGLGISAHLDTAWNGSAWRIPILVPPTLVALWILRRNGGEWFAVPAAWPATQFYYVAMAFPAVVRRPALAAIVALPLPLLVPVVVMALAVLKVGREGRSALAVRPILGPVSRSRPPAPAVGREQPRTAATDN